MVEPNRLKFKVQRIIAISSVLLLIGKLIAYQLTNSVGVLTDALESIVNVTAGFISLISIYQALKPKDKNHPYGHGKAEQLSASTEGILIFLAGAMIIYEAVKRLFLPAQIERLDIGIIIVALAGLINYGLGYYSIFVGKRHNSMALVAGGKHLQSDTYSSIGLVIGLILLYVTKIAWLDSAIAILFGLIIIYTGVRILMETVSNLMDETDFVEIEKLAAILWQHRSGNWIEVHNLKIVKYGDLHHVDCDITLPWYLNIREAHSEGDALSAIVAEYYTQNVDISLHTDACDESLCHRCPIHSCAVRVHPFEKEIPWSTESIIMEN